MPAITSRRGASAAAVAPTAVDTPQWRADAPDADLAARRAERARVIPLGRIGEPADVAAAVLFLLSPASAFVTGHVLPLTGGEIMP